MLRQEVLCLIVALLIGSAYPQRTFLDVETDQGIVRGFTGDVDSVISFYGIPYATAPTGENRYKGPLPPPTWSDVFLATERNIICPQPEIFSDTFLNLTRTIDCLKMNIFVPNVPDTNLPVMLYVHGGGWKEGYGMIFSPIDLAAKGIIAVNINYRLGFHGFLCLGTDFAPGNAAHKDIIAALRWLKRNIARFGGDPDNVSLAGSSAGSVSSQLVALSPMSKGLFSKLVSESGASLNVGNQSPLLIAETFANQLGVTTYENVMALENFFRSLSDEQLNTNSNGFATCIENHSLNGVEKFLDRSPVEIGESGDFEKRPYLTGFTPMEGLEFTNSFEALRPSLETNIASFLPTDITFKSEEVRNEIAAMVKKVYFPTGEITDHGMIDFFTDSVFMYPQMDTARMHADNSVEVYLYLFSYNGSINLPSISSSAIWGPGHVAQSLYLQEYDYSPIYDNMTQEDELTQARLQEMYINFFKFGKPIPVKTELLNVDWKPMTLEDEEYLDIGSQLKSSQSPLAERVALWDEVYRITTTSSANNLQGLLLLNFVLFLIKCAF